MKKKSYNTKTSAELTLDLATLRTQMQSVFTNSRQGKNTKEYVVARKNIARVMTALRQAKGKTLVSSTETEK